MYDILHPSRRTLTAIRGYTRLGGLPDNPRTDPQDRAWFGPHDRLFPEEESEPLDFKPGPEYGASASPSPLSLSASPVLRAPMPYVFERLLTCGWIAVWCWGWDGAGDLDGPDVDPIWEKMSEKSQLPSAVEIRHDRSMDI